MPISNGTKTIPTLSMPLVKRPKKLPQVLPQQQRAQVLQERSQQRPAKVLRQLQHPKVRLARVPLLPKRQRRTQKLTKRRLSRPLTRLRQKRQRLVSRLQAPRRQRRRPKHPKEMRHQARQTLPIPQVLHWRLKRLRKLQRITPPLLRLPLLTALPRH